MIPSYHATMLPCYHVKMIPCYLVTMLPRYHVIKGLSPLSPNHKEIVSPREVFQIARWSTLQVSVGDLESSCLLGRCRLHYLLLHPLPAPSPGVNFYLSLPSSPPLHLPLPLSLPPFPSPALSLPFPIIFPFFLHSPLPPVPLRREGGVREVVVGASAKWEGRPEEENV